MHYNHTEAQDVIPQPNPQRAARFRPEGARGGSRVRQGNGQGTEIPLRQSQRGPEIAKKQFPTMALEDQENAKARLQEAFAEKKMELKNEMPKFLWD